jgi:hypothetical protein
MLAQLIESRLGQDNAGAEMLNHAGAPYARQPLRVEPDHLWLHRIADELITDSLPRRVAAWPSARS